MPLMQLPVMPPVKPMLAKSVPTIPTGEMSYEPKWDGFRSIVFRDGDDIEIGSRNEKPMTRYFPELDRGLPGQPAGQVRARRRDRRGGRRPAGVRGAAAAHPPGRQPDHAAVGADAGHVRRLRPAGPRGRTDYTTRPFAERRAALEEALADVPGPVHVTPTTDDPAVAQDWFEQFEGAGLDGVVAKPLAGTYQPDKRTMFKIKHQRTADCVVAGYRVHKSGPDSIGSLLLGLYNEAGDLASVGVIGAFPAARRRELFAELQPLVTTFDDHPWAWAKQEEASPHAAALRRQPVEQRQGPVLRPAASRAGRRGPLRAHGGCPLSPHRPVQPLATGP